MTATPSEMATTGEPLAFRELARQMQSEFARATAALDKQVDALSRHNELLRAAQDRLKACVPSLSAHECALFALLTRIYGCRENAALREELEQAKSQQEQRSAADDETQRMQEERDAALQECDAIKRLFQQEQDFWRRVDEGRQREAERLTQQLVEARAEASAHQEISKTLRRELRELQTRVDSAVRTSQAFDQRLQQVADDKRAAMADMDAHMAKMKIKLQDKREEIKFLTDALVRLQQQHDEKQHALRHQHNKLERNAVKEPEDYDMEASNQYVDTKQQTSLDYTDKYGAKDRLFKIVDSHQKSVPSIRRVRKREIGLTLPEYAGRSGAHAVSGDRLYKAKRGEHDSSPRSSSGSSPEVSPRTATTTTTSTSSPTFKRAPSIATTSPTTSAGQMSSNSSHSSLHSVRSRVNREGRIKNVTDRRGVTRRPLSPLSSANTSNSANAALGRIATNTANTISNSNAIVSSRLERELSGLRRRMDACMPKH